MERGAREGKEGGVDGALGAGGAAVRESSEVEVGINAAHIGSGVYGGVRDAELWPTGVFTDLGGEVIWGG